MRCESGSDESIWEPSTEGTQAMTTCSRRSSSEDDFCGCARLEGHKGEHRCTCGNSWAEPSEPAGPVEQQIQTCGDTWLSEPDLPCELHKGHKGPHSCGKYLWNTRPAPVAQVDAGKCDVCGEVLEFPSPDDPAYAGDTAVTSKCRHTIRAVAQVDAGKCEQALRSILKILAPGNRGVRGFIRDMDAARGVARDALGGE